MRGILIINTGTPRSVKQQDVRQFIGDMLSDAKLVDLPNPFRYILARWIIAPKRQVESTHHYQQIWNYQENTSPLLYHTQQLCLKLEDKIHEPVVYAFRYGHPNAKEAIKLLEERVPNMTELVVMHMFPHFAQSSYQTAIDEVAKAFRHKKRKYSIRIIPPYYNHPAFIRCLSNQIRPFVAQAYDKLIFSYHSLPLKHLEREYGKGVNFDYTFQANETLRLVSQQLCLDQAKNCVAYSSAIADDWQRPFLDDLIEGLPSQGVKKVVVACAGFPIDNLESLYDIGIQAKEIFQKHGGETLHFVPGLNSENMWVEAIGEIINT